ncbi:MAG: hypothetical protein KJ017_11665 [Alphaproteobacteria bacterium]|nr:hypothetical protein [Alphaproteobacteria bacterium]
MNQSVNFLRCTKLLPRPPRQCKPGQPKAGKGDAIRMPLGPHVIANPRQRVQQSRQHKQMDCFVSLLASSQ